MQVFLSIRVNKTTFNTTIKNKLKKVKDAQKIRKYLNGSADLKLI